MPPHSGMNSAAWCARRCIACTLTWYTPVRHNQCSIVRSRRVDTDVIPAAHVDTKTMQAGSIRVAQQAMQASSIRVEQQAMQAGNSRDQSSADQESTATQQCGCVCGVSQTCQAVGFRPFLTMYSEIYKMLTTPANLPARLTPSSPKSCTPLPLAFPLVTQAMPFVSIEFQLRNTTHPGNQKGAGPTCCGAGYKLNKAASAEPEPRHVDQGIYIPLF